MRDDKKVKFNRMSIEILDNGFTIERRGNNPFGADPCERKVCTNSEELMSLVMGALAHNAIIDAERKAAAEEKD